MRKMKDIPIEINNWTTENSTAAKNELLNIIYRNEAKMYTS